MSTPSSAPKANAAPPRTPRVTLEVLARHLGLSKTTISVVVSDAPAAQGIPATTRERILQAAHELNYRPNYLAASLRGSRSMSVGVLATESSEGYFTLVMSGVEQALLDAKYLYLSAMHYGRQELVDEYARLFGERSVDGLLLISTPLPTESLPASAVRPIVSISGHMLRAGATNIALDHRRAAQLALTHLQALGHSRIVFLRGQSFNVDTDERWKAITTVAAELGIAVDPALCITLELHSWSPATGFEPVKRLLALRRDFTAVFCFNDISAIGVLRALHEAGIGVPTQVSVMGFDDVVCAQFCVPSLTTVRQPLIEMGKLAAETLLRKIRNPTEEFPLEMLLEPTLAVRESTCRARPL